MKVDFTTIDWTAIAAIATAIAAVAAAWAARAASHGIKIAVEGTEVAKAGIRISENGMKIAEDGIRISKDAVAVAESSSRLDRRAYLDNLVVNLKNAYAEMDTAAVPIAILQKEIPKVKGTATTQPAESDATINETDLRYRQAVLNLKTAIDLLRISGICETHVEAQEVSLETCLRILLWSAWVNYFSLSSGTHLVYTNRNELWIYLSELFNLDPLEAEYKAQADKWLDDIVEIYEKGDSFHSTQLLGTLLDTIMEDFLEEYRRLVDQLRLGVFPPR